MSLKMPPTIWGPIFWHTIHIVALGYPEKPNYSQKKAAKEFFESLRFLIPCKVCQEHYIQHLALTPITPFLDRRSDLLKWTIDLHNRVNESLKKPKMSEMDVLRHYKRLGALGRSPLWTDKDFAEADMRARIQGIGIGAGTAIVAGFLLWWTTKGEK